MPAEGSISLISMLTTRSGHLTSPHIHITSSELHNTLIDCDTNGHSMLWQSLSVLRDLAPDLLDFLVVLLEQGI